MKYWFFHAETIVLAIFSRIESSKFLIDRIGRICFDELS